MGILEQRGEVCAGKQEVWLKRCAGSITKLLCDPGRVALLLWASVLPSVKWVIENREKRLLASAMTTGRPRSRPVLSCVPILLGFQGLHLSQVGFEYQKLLLFFPLQWYLQTHWSSPDFGKSHRFVVLNGVASFIISRIA